MEKFFKLKEHGTTAKIEIMAGITTFLAMAYVIFVNPAILSAPANIMGDAALSAQIYNAVFIATCISAFVGTFLMAVLAKLPFAQAPGMGLNAFFAYTVMLTLGYSFSEALSLVFISGILFIVVTVLGVREAIVRAIPHNIKIAISGGIGLFVAFVGLQNSGIIEANESTAVSMINFSNLFSSSADAATKVAVWAAVLTLVGLVIAAVLHTLKINGALLISVFAVTILGIPVGVTVIPTDVFSGFMATSATQWNDFFSVGFLKFAEGFVSLFAGKDIVSTVLTLIVLVISFSLVDMFDTIGTLLGTAKRAGLMDKDGNMPQMKEALLCDAIATTTGSMVGSSTVTTYVESSAGIGAGGKTGLTALTTAILFLVAIPFGPFIAIVPSAATAPALILVGGMMLQGLKDLDFDNFDEVIPAYLTIAMMPLSYSIANGIAFGLISYTFIKILTGKAKEVQPLTAILAVLFIVRFFLIGM